MSFGEDVATLVENSENPALAKASSWERVHLGEVAAILNGYPWKSDRFGQSGVPLIRIRDVTTGRTETRYDGPLVDGYWVDRGDLLVGMDGDFNLRRWNADRGLLNQRVCKITANAEAYASQFLEYALPGYLKLINDATSSVTVKHLSSRTLAKVPLPLPPAAEQRRIVAKLDTLTARLARARAELDRVPVLAANLRATSVTDAFRGVATAEHRLQSSDQAADDAHLGRKYEEIAGRVRRKPVEPIDWRPDISIPSSWRWVSVDQVIARAQYGSSSKTSGDLGVPVLRMGNIQGGRIDFANLKYLPDEHTEFPELYLQPGDVIFNRTNSFELVGKSAVFCGADTPVSFASYLIRVQCCAIRPKLLAYYLNSAIGRQWVASVASQQVGQANVNGTKLRGFGIPLPPEREQAAMEAWIDNAFARADRMEAEAARARALIDRLEAAILARAFRGELVPQDPNDEPASVLLDRIRAERAAAPKPQRGRRAKAG